MSAESRDSEVVQRVWETLARGGVPAAEDIARDAEVVGAIFPVMEAPGEDLTARIDRVMASVERRVRLLRVDVAPDGRVVALGVASQHSASGGSSQLVAVVYTLRDGCIRRAEVFHDVDRAYAAVGLERPAPADPES